jgi:hypothetical protein
MTTENDSFNFTKAYNRNLISRLAISQYLAIEKAQQDDSRQNNYYSTEQKPSGRPRRAVALPTQIGDTLPRPIIEFLREAQKTPQTTTNKPRRKGKGVLQKIRLNVAHFLLRDMF